MSRENEFDDFNLEHEEGDNDSERFSNFDEVYDYSDNAIERPLDNENLKEWDKKVEEYERLRSEYKELQKDIKEYDEKIYKLVEKSYEAQAKKDEEQLESLRIRVDYLRQTLKERKDRLNEVAKKLDYFEGKNSKSNDRWGVDPQPQLQIDDSTPADVMVDVSDIGEPKKSLEGVDLSKFKNRRSRRNSTKTPSIKTNTSTKTNNSKPKYEIPPTESEQNWDAKENKIYSLLEEGKVDEALEMLEFHREFKLPRVTEITESISKVYDIPYTYGKTHPKFESMVRGSHNADFVPDFSEIRKERGLDIKEEPEKLDGELEKIVEDIVTLKGIENEIEKTKANYEQNKKELLNFNKLVDYLKEGDITSTEQYYIASSDHYRNIANNLLSKSFGFKFNDNADFEIVEDKLDKGFVPTIEYNPQEELDKLKENYQKRIESFEKGRQKYLENINNSKIPNEKVAEVLEPKLNNLSKEYNEKREKLKTNEEEVYKLQDLKSEEWQKEREAPDGSVEGKKAKEKQIKYDNEIEVLRGESREISREIELLERNIQDIENAIEYIKSNKKNNNEESEKLDEEFEGEILEFFDAGGNEAKLTHSTDKGKRIITKKGKNRTAEYIDKKGNTIYKGPADGTVDKETYNKIQEIEEAIKDLKKELEKQAEERRNVKREAKRAENALSYDVGFDEYGNVVENIPTIILDDGTEKGDIDDLTWDDVIYDPETREYINRHNGEIVKGRPQYEEDPKKKAKEREERLKGDKGLYSSILETIGAGKKGVVVKGEKDKDYTEVDLAQERANEEYEEIMGEINDEIREAYNKIHNLNEVAPEYYSEKIAEEKEKLQGLFNLKAEIGKFAEEKWDNKKGKYVRTVHREDETPGTFRAIKEAYEEAGYKSEIGEGLGQAVHHLEGYNWKVDARTDIDNLILLSDEIHNEFHRIFGAGNNTIEQFVEFLKEYHPEELPKFMERYGDKFGIPQNIDEKLIEERGKWDDDLYRKQYNRWDKLQWIKEFDKEKDKALTMAYSNFFLKDVEIPVEQYQIGDRIFQSKRMASSNEDILDVYEDFVKNDWKRFDDMDESQLAHVLNSRLTVEALNGIINEKDVIDIDTLKGWSRDKLLEGLDASQMRGRKMLEDTVSGKRKFSFLGEEFSNGEGENPFADTGLGKGLIPVINELKDFFDKYSVSFGIPNPFDGWDATGDISPGSRNVEILSRLFNVDDVTDGFNAQQLLTRVIANLPVKGGRPITNTSDPKLIRDRIRDFNDEYYDTIEEKGKPDKDMLDFRNAKNNLAYLLGIGRNGVSTETINRFFSPRGARKPLSDRDVALSFDFVPALSTDTDKIDADLADMYEALGFEISIGEQGGLVLAKELQREGLEDSDTRDEIFNLPANAVVMIDSPKIETRAPLDEENEKALNTLFGKTDESKKRTLKSGTFGCCEEIINKLGEIDKVLQDIASLVSDTIDLFSNEMWNMVINGGNSGGSNNSQKQEGKPYKGDYRSGQNYKSGYYGFRVEELEELINTTEDDVIKDFAEKALKYANPLNDNGFNGEVKQQDLILALFGKFPDFSNTSAEEWDDYASNLEVIRERWRGITTQEYKDKKLAEIDEKIKTAQIRKEYTGGSEYDKEIARLKAEKERLLAKEVVGEDIYKYIDLLKKAYEAVVQGPAPFENYYDELNNLIISIDREDTKIEGLTRSRIKSMEEGIKEADKDVTEQVDRALDKIERMLKIYRGDLRKDIPVDEKADIREKIDKLNELKSHLTGEEVEEEENPHYSRFSPNIPHPSDRMFDDESLDDETWKLRPKDLDLTDDELVRIKGEIENLKARRDAIKSEYTKGLLTEQIEEKTLEYEERKKKLLRQPPNPSPSDVFQSDMYDHIEHTTEGSALDYRWDYFREQFNNLRVALTVLQKDAIFNPDGVEDMREEYDKVLEKLAKIRETLYKLAEEEGFTHTEELEALEEEFGKIGISIDEVIEKEKELDSYLDEVAKKNQVGVDALFGDKKAQKQVFGDDWVNETYKSETQEKAPLEGRLTRMAYNFRQASQSANQFTGVLTKLFAIVGSGNAINDMITASSLRQTNQIMLASRRGMEEAKKLYDRIQMLVVKLPGNDTFLTNILTMLGTMDETLSAEDLEYMGGVIADYYMGAQAKGQFNNETERELRNYLMTGQTRNLTNSIIASEIESLKNLNSVKERTIALEKALKATGMDSIAHYDSYTNSLEEFKGRFQKAFADLGDTYLGLLQGLMKVYNFLDNLTNSALSQFVIVGAVLVMGVLAFVAVMAELLSIGAGLVESFDALNKVIRENDKAYSGLAQTFRKVITWIAYKTGVVNADTASKVINTNVTLRSIFVEGIYGRVIKGTIWGKIKSIGTTVWDTAVRYKNAYAQYTQATAMQKYMLLVKGETEIKRIATLVNYKNAISRAFNTLSMWIENKTLKENTKRLIENTKEKITNYLLNLKDTAVKWAGVVANMALYGSTLLLSGALAILNFMLSPIGLVIVGIVVAVWLLIKAFEALGQAFGWWDNIGEMFQAIGDGIRRTWDAFVNSEPVQEIIKAFQNLAYTLEVLFNWIGSIAGNIWQTIFGVDDGSKGEVFDIVGVFLEVVGAIGKFAYMTSPLKLLIELMNAIGSSIAWFLDTWNEFTETKEFQGLLRDFQEIREVLKESWDILASAFAEVKEAFMSVFKDDEEMQEAIESTNILLDVLKAIAMVIRITVIPVIKTVAYFIKGIADIIKFIADVGAGTINFLTGNGLAESSSSLLNQKQLAQNYNAQTNTHTTIINNNFSEGSVQADARNMTSKDVIKLFTGAFGFNGARGINGAINGVIN